MEIFFGGDKKGEEIFPIIDRYFIKQFCDNSNITLDTFESLIKNRYIGFITSRSTIKEILGFIGIQLYGASKMEKSYGISSTNFRDRIGPEILGIESTEWDYWAKENQDAVWHRFYRWCDEEGYVISNRCTPKTGKDRYVQYPKNHSDMILNREDLKRIAFSFVEKDLLPGEDITEKEFWKILGRCHLYNYYTRRSQNIIEKRRDIANKQIYQYYLSWNGEYIDGYKNEKVEDPNLISLYFDDKEWIIDIKNSKDNIHIKSLNLIKIRSQREIEKFYRFRRKNIILFTPNEEYDDYWDEVRFLQTHSSVGYALFFDMDKYDLYDLKDIVRRFNNFVLVKIYYCERYNYLFAEDRPYSLSGGIKIASKTYLLGAAPLLEFTDYVPYWIDGEQYSPILGLVHLKLNEGKHIIKIKGYKSFEINISDDIPKIREWDSPYSWKLSQHPNPTLKPEIDTEGVVGLDFSNYSQILSKDKKESDKCMIHQWKRKLIFNDSITIKNNSLLTLLER